MAVPEFKNNSLLPSAALLEHEPSLAQLDVFQRGGQRPSRWTGLAAGGLAVVTSLILSCDPGIGSEKVVNPPPLTSQQAPHESLTKVKEATPSQSPSSVEGARRPYIPIDGLEELRNYSEFIDWMRKNKGPRGDNLTFMHWEGGVTGDIVSAEGVRLRRLPEVGANNLYRLLPWFTVGSETPRWQTQILNMREDQSWAILFFNYRTGQYELDSAAGTNALVFAATRDKKEDLMRVNSNKGQTGEYVTAEQFLRFY